MRIALPDASGALTEYRVEGTSVTAEPMGRNPARSVLAAAHVVADPFVDAEPSNSVAVDWEATMRFRRHLADLGLGIAEAMDTAQRGMGLDWPRALELIRRTREELPGAIVFNGCGTDHLAADDVHDLNDVCAAYRKQAEAIQGLDGRLILMASRALARVAKGPEDYAAVYSEVLAVCDRPVILHWLGEMFDPGLAGYWGADAFGPAMETVLGIIETNAGKIDGIKVSLLDREKEIEMRRRLPVGVKMYTGDDFNYPELIAGDSLGHSHALLGIFDPLAAVAARAVNLLGRGDAEGFRAALDPTVPLARHVFRPPTQYYKTGVVFLAWLNGFQDHFAMIGGAQSMRPLPYFSDCFRLADQAGVLADPELAVVRMKRLLAVYGVA